MSRQRVRYLCTICTLCHMKSNFLEFCHILVDRCVCCVCRWCLEVRRRLADYAMWWKGGCCFRPFSNPSTITPAGRRFGAWGGESSLKVRVKRSGTWPVVLALSGKRGLNSAVVLSLLSGWLTGIAWRGTVT